MASAMLDASPSRRAVGRRGRHADRSQPSLLSDLLGALGRSWLWFVGACLVIALLPMAWGWRPYVIETGSMLPAIAPGDVVLSAPTRDSDVVLGRIASFHDVSRDGHIVTHRVIGLNDDGSYETKGDANAQPDSTPLRPEQVEGVGRLLVKDAGLPLVWLKERAWVPLGLFVLSLLLATWFAARDPEDDSSDAGTDGDPDDAGVDGPEPGMPSRPLAF